MYLSSILEKKNMVVSLEIFPYNRPYPFCHNFSLTSASHLQLSSLALTLLSLVPVTIYENIAIVEKFAMS